MSALLFTQNATLADANRIRTRLRPNRVIQFSLRPPPGAGGSPTICHFGATPDEALAALARRLERHTAELEARPGVAGVEIRSGGMTLAWVTQGLTLAETAEALRRLRA